MTSDESKTVKDVRATAQNAKTGATAAVNAAKDQLARASELQLKTADDVAAFGKSNIEALTQAGSIFFHGMEELTRTVVGATQAQVETNMSVAKALIGAKTLTEFTDLQNSFAKTAIDKAMSEATRLSEMTLRIATSAIEPLSARVTATIDQMSKPAYAA